MQYKAKCPNCKTRVPRHIAWNKRQRDAWVCRTCKLKLQRFDADRQPYTAFIVLAIISPLIVSVVVAALLQPLFGAFSFLFVLLGGLIVFVINWLQFPYTNGYRLWPPVCDQCGYDIRETAGGCPECGAPRVNADHNPAQMNDE